jgi:hypothetical protein
MPGQSAATALSALLIASAGLCFGAIGDLHAIRHYGHAGGHRVYGA